MSDIVDEDEKKEKEENAAQEENKDEPVVENEMTLTEQLEAAKA